MTDKKILYVDNPSGIPEVMMRTLGRGLSLGFVEAYTMSDALEYLKTTRFDGAFMGSLRIPAGSAEWSGEYCERGLEIARRCKETGLPVVVMSGTVDSSVIKRVKDIGVDLFISRPEEGNFTEQIGTVFKAERRGA